MVHQTLIIPKSSQAYPCIFGSMKECGGIFVLLDNPLSLGFPRNHKRPQNTDALGKRPRKLRNRGRVSISQEGQGEGVGLGRGGGE